MVRLQTKCVGFADSDPIVNFGAISYIFLSTFLFSLFVNWNYFMQETLSTLDLVPGDKLEFVLIIAPVKESYDLARVILRTAEEFKVSVKVCIMWPQGSFVQKLRGSRVELDPWENFIDVEEVKRPSSTTSWLDTCRMTSHGVLLVRPDEHIAWMAESNKIDNAVSEARRVFAVILAAENTSL